MYNPDFNDPDFINFEYLNTPFPVSKDTSRISYLEFYEEKNLKQKKSNYIKIEKLPTKWREAYKIKLNIQSKGILCMEELTNKSLYNVSRNNKYIDFSPGDSLGIIPINSVTEVKEVLNYFNIKENIIVDLENTNIEYTGSVLYLLKHIELYSIPTKKFCKEVYNLLNETLNCEKTPELKFLRFLISPNGINHYMRLMEVRIIDFFKFCLQGIESKEKFFNLFVKHSMKNKPRFYSICNYNKNENELELLIGIEQAYHGMGLISSLIVNSYEKFGTASHEIENIFVYRQSKLLDFHGLKNNSKKILFICTGTAIASFIFQIKQIKPEDFVCLYGYRDESDNILNYLDITEDLKRSFVCVSSRNQKIHELLNLFYLNKTDTVELTMFKKLIGDHRELNRLYICGSIGVMKNIYGVIKDWDVSKTGNLFFDSWV